MLIESVDNPKERVESNDIKMFISGIKLFFDIDTEVISDISKKIKFVTFDQGDLLIQQGHSDKLMYIIWDGEITIKLPTKDLTRGKGEIIGEISMLTGNPYSVDVAAHTKVKAFAIDYEVFQDLITTNRKIAKAFTTLMVSRLDIMRQQGVLYVRKYQMLDKIGEGSIAVVYDGYDPELKREVAIKMLKYEVAVKSNLLHRFKQEAITIAQLAHPNIVQVFDIIEDYSTIFIVMEKVVGQDLDLLLKKKGFFFPDEVRTILIQVAQALSYTHQQGENGIIHRDIKPSNMIIDKSNRIKLMDFGLAGPPQAYSNEIEGTVNYLAPEVVLGEAIDGRVDIYALGITAYKMLTGELPFNSSDSKELLKMHVTHEVPNISEKYPHIPKQMVEFIMRALVKDPQKRISDWNKILELLGASNALAKPTDSQEMVDVCVNINIHRITDRKSRKFVDSIKQLLKKNHLDFSISTSEVKTVFQYSNED